MRDRALTCDLEGGVPTPDAAVLVARHAVVHSGVDVDPGVQEEEAPVGQLRGGMFIVGIVKSINDELFTHHCKRVNEELFIEHVVSGFVCLVMD